MKEILVVFLIGIVTLCACSESEYVHIPDKNLAQAIREKINQVDGRIHRDSLLNITRLRVRNMNKNNLKIKDLTGLEYLVNLRDLDLQYNDIQNIKSLQKLKHLQRLNLNTNPNLNIDGIGKIKSLKHLNLFNTAISNLDNLKGLDSLRWLNVGCSKLKNYKGIEYLHSLEYFEAFSNDVTDLSAFSNLKNIEELYLINNKLDSTSLYAIKNLNTLKKLNIGNGSVTIPQSNDNVIGVLPLEFKYSKFLNVNILSGLANLEELSVTGVFLEDVHIVSNFKKLKHLTIEYNRIQNYTPLYELKELEKLSVAYNNISKEDYLRLVNALPNTEIWISVKEKNKYNLLTDIEKEKYSFMLKE